MERRKRRRRPRNRTKSEKPKASEAKKTLKDFETLEDVVFPEPVEISDEEFLKILHALEFVEKGSALPFVDCKINSKELGNVGSEADPEEIEEIKEEKVIEKKPKKKPLTWGERWALIKIYFIKRAKYFWKHRVGTVIVIILLALCIFPFWVAYTYVSDEGGAYRDRRITYEEFLALNDSNYTVSCQGPKITNDYRLRFAMLSVYGVIFVVGTFGNSLVIYVILTNSKMRTVTNLFITNLAISDLLVSTTSLWLTPLYIYTGHWIWGEWLCYGFPLFQGSSIFISSFTLMSIAVDRYLVIVHRSVSRSKPYDSFTMPICVAVIAMIWGLSISFVMPYAVHMRLSYIHIPCHYYTCLEDWAQNEMKAIFGFIVLLLQFIMPFVVIFVSYKKIWVFINRRFKRRAMELGGVRKVDSKKRKRVLRMLMTMVFVFAFCWFPVNALNVLRDFHGMIPMRPYFNYAFITAHMISMMGTAFNPILYAWMNEHFREQFIKTIPLLRWILSKNKRNAARQKIITDCTPASNRINCGDRVQGGQKLKNGIDIKTKSLLLTTKIPDFSDRVYDYKTQEEAYELRELEPSSSRCNENHNDNDNNDCETSNFLKIPDKSGLKMRCSSNSDISIDECRSLVSNFSYYDEF